MPFPEKTFLTRPVRRAIMACLIISFFVLAPLVVLYTMGYRFDFTTRSIKTTGVLNIDTLPKRATVKINNVVLDDTMPIKLFNRAPGTYMVEISADGHHTWKKDIRIESNQTTYIKGLTLFVKTTPTEITRNGVPTNIFFSPNGESGIATYTDFAAPIQQITLYDYKGPEAFNLTTTTPESHVNVSWAENGTDYAIEIIEKTQTRLISGSTQSNITSSEIIALTTTSLRYQWADTLLGNPSLFVGTSTLSTKINGETVTPLSHPSTTPIWYSTNGTDVWTYSTSTRALSHKENILFSSVEADTIIFASERTALLRQGDQHIFVAKESDGTQRTTLLPGPHNLYIPQTKEWVLYSPYEVAILYNDGTYNTIYRTDEPIISVLTLEDTGVLLITKKNQLLGFNPGFYTSQVLLQTDSIESIGVDQRSRTIFFLGTVETRRGIYSLQY
jgi:hypothetical protein